VRAAGRTVVALFALAAAGLIGVGVLREQEESKFLAGAAKSLGDVTEIQTVPIDEQTNRYCAIVAFTPPSGKPVSFVNSNCAPGQLQRIGDKVPVLYDPNDPMHARIFENTGPWAVALPFLAWAVLSLVGAVIAALVFKRMAR
jgi:hypothetical protein